MDYLLWITFLHLGLILLLNGDLSEMGNDKVPWDFVIGLFYYCSSFPAPYMLLNLFPSLLYVFIRGQMLLEPVGERFKNCPPLHQRSACVSRLFQNTMKVLWNRGEPECIVSIVMENGFRFSSALDKNASTAGKYYLSFEVNYISRFYAVLAFNEIIEESKRTRLVDLYGNCNIFVETTWAM